MLHYPKKPSCDVFVSGAERFCDNIEDMIGYKPLSLIKYCWLYTTPLICSVSVFSSTYCIYINVLSSWSQIYLPPLFQGTFVFLILRYMPLKFNNSYVYPWWAYCIGWFLAMSSLTMIPAIMITKLSKERGTLWQVSGVSAWYVMWELWRFEYVNLFVLPGQAVLLQATYLDNINTFP